MKIAIVGLGGIGSTFAVQLARAGHDITAIARNKRLERLRSDGGVRVKSAVVPLTVAEALPADIAYDLVLVTTLAHQVVPLLPSLRASEAKAIMFMFNTFASLDVLRDAVGAERCHYGFPAILAQVDADGLLTTSIQDKGLLTTVTDASWARVFSEAGIKTVTTPDMQAWLRSHAAAVTPVMLLAAESHRTKSGISWDKARELANVMSESFALVHELGHPVIPTAHAILDRLPSPAVASMLWLMSRAPAIRASGAAGNAEPRALMDAMVAAAPHDLPVVARLRAEL